jgi:AraC-like DNA-binding protein
MGLQHVPDTLRFGSANAPLWIDFDRRLNQYAMSTNHYHMAYELYYLFSGKRNYFIKDSVYPVHPGDIVLVDSYTVHITSELGEPDHERIVFHFAPSFFTDFTQEDKELLLTPFAHANPLIKLNLQERIQVETLFHSLLLELSEHPLGYSLHVRNVAIELLLFVARLIEKSKVDPGVEYSPVQQKVMEIVRHINLNFTEPLNLDSLSKQFFISKGHLCRVFKEVTGFGFSEYVNLTRVKEAERLLRETDWSITQISEHCGFENFSHFGKVFKKLSGLPPRTYRMHKRSEG